MTAASIWPCSIAATDGCAEADADDGNARGIDAVLLQEIFEKEIGRGTGRADADFLAGEILDRFDLGGVRGRHHQHLARIAVVNHKGLQFLLPGGEIDAVVEIAGDHVGAAAEHGPQRVRTALQIDQFDRKSRLFILAELPGQHGRQIAQAGAAPDGDRHLALRRRESGNQHQRQQCRGKLCQHRPHDFLRAVRCAPR